MENNFNAYGDISPRTNALAKKRLLKRGQYDMVIERFGQVDPMMKNRTDTCKWRRYQSFPRALAPLSEGITPTGRKLTHVDVTATLEQYGDWTKITDKIEDTHEDRVLQEAMDILGEQAAETIEALRINILKTGTNVFYANGAASRAAVDSPPTRGDFRKVYRSFRANKARMISTIIKASHRISTEPVAAGFFVMGHTDLDADIRNISGFIPSEQYSDSSQALPLEIGKLDQFRFVLSNNFDPWLAAGTSGSTYLTNGASGTGSADVYPLLIVARDAYGIVPLQGYNSVDVKVVAPGKPTKSDPLGQIGFASWKTYQTAVILNNAWMARLEVAATASPS